MIKARTVTERAKKKVRKPLTYADILDMLGDSESNIQAALLDYFTSDKGRQDIERSPQAGKSPEEVVADLMEEIRGLKGARHGRTV